VGFNRTPDGEGAALRLVKVTASLPDELMTIGVHKGVHKGRSPHSVEPSATNELDLSLHLITHVTEMLGLRSVVSDVLFAEGLHVVHNELGAEEIQSSVNGVLTDSGSARLTILVLKVRNHGTDGHYNRVKLLGLVVKVPAELRTPLTTSGLQLVLARIGLTHDYPSHTIGVEALTMKVLGIPSSSSLASFLQTLGIQLGGVLFGSDDHLGGMNTSTAAEEANTAVNMGVIGDVLLSAALGATVIGVVVGTITVNSVQGQVRIDVEFGEIIVLDGVLFHGVTSLKFFNVVLLAFF
jgi:hypothetical protein